MSYRWWSCCRTTTGRQRSVNEDAYLSLDEQGLWLVADGSRRLERIFVLGPDGKPRALHVEQAMKVIRLEPGEPPPPGAAGSSAASSSSTPDAHPTVTPTCSSAASSPSSATVFTSASVRSGLGIRGSRPLKIW